VHKLPLADSTIDATATQCGATVWTLDADCEGLVGVRYVLINVGLINVLPPPFLSGILSERVRRSVVNRTPPAPPLRSEQ